MIVVHHLNNSRSQRILWLLEELGLHYEIKRYERNPHTMLAPPELLKVHPLGKSPVLADGALVVAESGAIVEYLLDTYGRQSGLRPEPGAPGRLAYNYWLHFAEGSAMPPLLLKLIFTRMKSAPMPFFAKPIARAIADKVLRLMVDPNLERQTAFIEAELAKTAWFVGDDFSAADIQMSFPLEAASKRAGVGPESTPRIVDWLARAHARPAYQRALARGGRYDYA
jgi:glutathione S-transferase